MRRIALFPGSFDPLTNGHLDILRSGMRLADHVVVAIGINPAKTPLLTVEERTALILEAAKPLSAETGATVAVQSFSALVVQFAKECGATLLLRGLRDGTDLDYEMQMAGMNAAMAPWLQTVFLPSAPTERPITATLVRQIATMGGDPSPFVPPAVAALLRNRIRKPS
jgi:pantetheine-phosphate adenylyltransferase